MTKAENELFGLIGGFQDEFVFTGRELKTFEQKLEFIKDAFGLSDEDIDSIREASNE